MIFVEGHRRDNRKTYIFLLYCVLGVSQVIYAVHRHVCILEPCTFLLMTVELC